MANLISAHLLRKAFGARPLFEGLTFAIESGEHVGLIGPNGAGKSTLLRILSGKDQPDQGTLSMQRGLRVGYLEQLPLFTPGATVESTALEGTRDPHDWECMALAHECLSKLGLAGGGEVTPEMSVDKLSGGWKKRVALARELSRAPDLLLLDEPTNHLDIESIIWLEEFIQDAPFATITITHDRAFLQKIARRIIELDRRNPGGLLSIQGDYADYLTIKEQTLQAQERREVILKNTLRRETEWLRRGAKARTTKQQARIKRQGELVEVVSELEYRNQNRTARIDFQGAERNPKKLLEAKGISKTYGSTRIVPPLDLLLSPGSRIGLLGPNGCGKSTLIRMLVGDEEPDTGEIKRADNLSIAYFEQNRETLDPKLSLSKTLCPSGDYVDYRGGRVHIRSYLDRFFFSADQMEMAVGKLSGGEQSRLLIARLMLQEANLLVLDEPTNDLDMATLNVLQDCLTEFPGSVLLVTHDRYFMDQVATRILAFGDGKVTPFADLAQWETWHADRMERGLPVAAKPAAKTGTPAAKKRLGFKEQRELDSMEATIQALDDEIARLTAESADPKASPSKLTELAQAIAVAQERTDGLYVRWAELTAKSEG